LKLYRTKKLKFPRPPICIDFDGVIHAYRKGFDDGSIYDIPVKGAREAMAALKKKYYVQVCSSRTRTRAGKVAVEAYLKKYKIPFDVVTSYKPPAKFYIDDRALRFENWKQTLKAVDL